MTSHVEKDKHSRTSDRDFHAVSEQASDNERELQKII